MNLAVTIPFADIQVADGLFYTALAALILTVAVAMIWKGLSKGAVLAIILVAAVIYIAVGR